VTGFSWGEAGNGEKIQKVKVKMASKAVILFIGSSYRMSIFSQVLC